MHPHPLKSFLYLFVSLIILTVGASCAKLETPFITLSEANKKFIATCRDEYGLDVVVKQLKNTVWVYVPVEDPVLQLKVTDEGPQKTDQPSVKNNLKFIDAYYSNGTFHIRYDITQDKAYAQSYGYTYATSEGLRTKQRHVLTALYRAYADVEQLPDEEKYVERVPGDVDYIGYEKNKSHKRLVHAFVKTSRVPDFFVLVMADVVNGIESEILFYFGDHKRGQIDHSFMDEYQKRIIADYPVGNKAIIGDRTGRHLEYKEITWPEFLSRQIVYRIRFKYTRSIFPPSADSQGEILKIVREAVDAYGFEDFTAVRLHDMHAKEDHTYKKSDVLHN